MSRARGGVGEASGASGRQAFDDAGPLTALGVVEAFDRWGSTTFSICNVLLGDAGASKIATHDVFARLSARQRSRGFATAEAQAAFLVQTARGYCLDALKSSRMIHRAQRQSSLGRQAADADVAAVLGLPNVCKVDACLYWGEGLDVETISRLTGARPTTTESHLESAGKMLAVEMGLPSRTTGFVEAESRTQAAFAALAPARGVLADIRQGLEAGDAASIGAARETARAVEQADTAPLAEQPGEDEAGQAETPRVQEDVEEERPRKKTGHVVTIVVLIVVAAVVAGAAVMTARGMTF